MKTTKYEIELPELPCGCYFVGLTRPKKGDFYLDHKLQWEKAVWDFPNDSHLVASRHETLADWANKQRLFQEFAQMRNREKSTVMQHNGNAKWTMMSMDNIGGVMSFEILAPPANLTGKLRLEAGKWVDVP